VSEDEYDLPGMHVRNVRSITEGDRRIEKRTTIERPGEVLISLFESVRLFTDEELTRMFAAAGFGKVRCYGSLGGEPYLTGSERLVVVGKRVS
jgi:hypothetical protein